MRRCWHRQFVTFGSLQWHISTTAPATSICLRVVQVVQVLQVPGLQRLTSALCQLQLAAQQLIEGLRGGGVVLRREGLHLQVAQLGGLA